ncbi:DapH/DapD/GlmU-related protein [Mucilaginibacter sp. SP1R1]|uniref:DapH/DapD/GlmU-related protein n=1 Tax=Mucilaginibacter sp. SP1R1 TaxID=2723091 RepID=UPI001619D589|nr:DapH/DapD/GlmU-related protein [Mucilaginibacter sp. SP1R1]MBB6149557.1 maltose O-acetyltransferase [Mucilaginibacter sp. SP1R1]
MPTNKFVTRLKNSLINRVISPGFIMTRILKYKMLSTCQHVKGNPICVGPVLIKGLGKVVFQDNVNIGVVASPYFYNTYCYIEARQPESSITIGSGVYLNNNACLISEGEGIVLGSNVLVGPNFTVFDSDFHAIDPSKRLNGVPKTALVKIDDNVFIGANVTILKGVNIGENSVIASNSLVSKSIPPNVIAGGNPCKVLKEITI